MVPIIPQQAVIHSWGATPEIAIENLHAKLDEMPDLRIVSISVTGGKPTWLVFAVVETV